MILLTQFLCLQLLDIMTTLAFLERGLHEANPVVRFFMEATSSPVSALLAVKIFAIVLGIYCWRSQRPSVLTKANVFFSAVVSWNLMALALN